MLGDRATTAPLPALLPRRPHWRASLRSGSAVPVPGLWACCPGHRPSRPWLCPLPLLPAGLHFHKLQRLSGLFTGAACALTRHAFPKSPAALPPSLSGISAAPKSGAQGVVTSVASRTGSSEGVSLLRAPAGASGPSVLVASHGTSEARRGPFPVCGLCLSNAALSFLVQRGFPPSLPITEISRRPTLSLTKPRTAGGRALPCTLWLGLVLSSFQEQEGHVFLLFFFFFLL